MRMPRVRFRVRHIMIAVAVVASLSTVVLRANEGLNRRKEVRAAAARLEGIREGFKNDRVPSLIDADLLTSCDSIQIPNPPQATDADAPGLILDPIPTPRYPPPSAVEITDALAGAKLENAKFLTELIGEKSDRCVSNPWVGPILWVRLRYKYTFYYDEHVDGVKRPTWRLGYLDHAFLEPCKENHAHGSP
jgi:hypothetical protein